MTDTIAIPGYEIVRPLGRGGMASVFLAVQDNLEREVALKVMSPHLSADPSFTTRFLREARIAANVHHASIVSVFDVGQHESYNYLSMEYLPCGDLKGRIEQGGYGAGFAAYVCIALCAALDLAHRKGFVHRDLKPENVLFREDGTPVLTDFGIARAIDSGTSLTMTGMMVGTPNYMSPEQIKGLKLDGRSDLYSLGIVLYQMLTGTVPFRADSSLSVAIKHLSEAVPPLPAELADYQPVLDRLTAKEPDARFATGAEVIQALRELGESLAGLDQTRIRTRGSSSARMPTSITPVVIPAVQTNRAPPKRSWLQRIRGGAGATSAGVSRAQDTSSYVAGSVIASRMPTFKPRPLPLVGMLAAIIAGVGIGMLLRNGEEPAERLADSNAGAPPPAASAPAPTAISVPMQQAESHAATHLPADTKQLAEEAVAQAVIDQPVTHHSGHAGYRAQQEEEQEKIRAEQQKVDSWLAEARSRFANGFLLEPKRASAVDSYQAVLKLHPADATARAGLRRIADLLVAEAERTELAGDVAQQRKLIGQIRSLQPQHPQLVGLEAGLRQNEAVPRQLSSLERSRLQDAARHIEKAQGYLLNKPVTWRAVDDATIQFDSAKSAALLAPGLPYLKDRIIANYAAAVRTELDRKDLRSAMMVIECARERGRNWFSPELQELEITVKKAMQPR